MALIIALQNKSALAPVSDYEATVYINEVKIDGPFIIKGHKRKDGWEALVKQFAEQLECEEFDDHKTQLYNYIIKGENK